MRFAEHGSAPRQACGTIHDHTNLHRLQASCSSAFPQGSRLKGKSLNVANEEIRTIISVLGMGTRDAFDTSRLQVLRIGSLTDVDVAILHIHCLQLSVLPDVFGLTFCCVGEAFCLEILDGGIQQVYNRRRNGVSAWCNGSARRAIALTVQGRQVRDAS